MISSEDTDVFLLFGFQEFYSSYHLRQMWHTGPYQVHQRHTSGGMWWRMCICLPGIHAFTGCDSVSAFAGKGKLTALKLARQNPSIQELFQRVGMVWEVSEELFMELQ